MIGDGIIVTVVDIDRGKVRIAIEAPPSVKIWREELLPRVRANQEEVGCGPGAAPAGSPVRLP